MELKKNSFLFTPEDFAYKRKAVFFIMKYNIYS